MKTLRPVITLVVFISLTACSTSSSYVHLTSNGGGLASSFSRSDGTSFRMSAEIKDRDAHFNVGTKHLVVRECPEVYARFLGVNGLDAKVLDMTLTASDGGFFRFEKGDKILVEQPLYTLPDKSVWMLNRHNDSLTMTHEIEVE